MADVIFDLIIGADNLITAYYEVESGPNAAADLSGATVTYELKDINETVVDSGSLTHAASGSPNTDGQYIYYGNIPDSVSLTEGDSYDLETTFNGGAGLQFFSKDSSLAKYA